MVLIVCWRLGVLRALILKYFVEFDGMFEAIEA